MELVHELSENQKLLNAFTQPVVLVRGKQIVRRNDAARTLLPEQELPQALAEALEDGVEQAQLLLESRLWDARMTQLEDLTCISLSRHDMMLDSAMLSTISRVLREPLTTLFATGRDLFTWLEELEDEHVQNQTATMHRDMYRLLRLANNLSDADRYLNMENRLELKQIDLAKELKELEYTLSPLVESCGVGLEIQRPTAQTLVCCDWEKVRRALLELVSNGVKYTNRNSVMRLSGEAEAGAIRFQVRSPDQEMDPGLVGDLDRLLVEHSGIGSGQWGVGLGLYIALQTARLHGGTLMAHTPPEGGTVMTMTLARQELPQGPLVLRQNVWDHRSGFDPYLVVLADVLPDQIYNSVDTIF